MPESIPDRAEWNRLMRNPHRWRHSFGPPESPVVVAGVSTGATRIVASLAALARRLEPGCVIVEGPAGSGKSLAAAAHQAACQAQGTPVTLINEGTQDADVMRRMRAPGAVIVDNLELLSPGLRSAVFEARHEPSLGTLVTSARIRAIEREQLGIRDEHFQLERLQERPRDTLILASLAWDELGIDPPLHEVVADGTAEALCSCVLPRGASSVRLLVRKLATNLELEGRLDGPYEINGADVLSAAMAVLQEEHKPEPDDVVALVVEGSTDVQYLSRGRQLAMDAWGEDPLAAFRLEAAGEGRRGGANEGVRKLLAYELQGNTAIGLFDNDAPGREAEKRAKKLLLHQPVLLIPQDFDRLGHPPSEKTIEIEDLLPVELLEAFYESHPDLSPEETVERDARKRMVVRGADKDTAADWLCAQGDFEAFKKIICLILLIRRQLGLPSAPGSPEPTAWLSELAAQSP